MRKLFNIFLSLIMVLTFTLKDSSYADDVIRTIAVLDFENNTGSTSQDNLKKALSDSLTNNLAQYKSLSIVERTRLKDAASEVTLSQSSFISADNAIKIGKTLGAEYVLLGSISKIGEIFEVSERIVEVETSKIIDAKSIRCSKAEAILKAVDYLALEIARTFGEKIDKTLLEAAKKDVDYANTPELVLLKNDEKANSNPVIIQKETPKVEKKEEVSNNSWVLWAVGGVVLVGVATAGVIIAMNSNKKVTQNVCIGSNCNKPIINNPADCGPPKCPIINKPIINRDLSIGFSF